MFKERETIEEKIATEKNIPISLPEGYPQIFPFDWHLIEQADDPINSRWSGNFTSDLT